MTIEKYIDTLGTFSNRKIVLVGATTGVGLELLKHLVNLKAKIVLLAIEKELSQKLKEEYGLEDVIYYDQSNQAQIDNAINELLNKHQDFDTIVLNAGVLGPTKTLENGYPATIAINYIGNRYFIDTITPRLSWKVKFVITGSFVAGFSLKKKHDLKNPHMKKYEQYNISKIYLEGYFYKLASEHKYPNIDYVCVEPGLTNSGIIRNLNKVTRFLGKWFLKFFFHSTKKASLCLLTGVSINSSNGDFITPRGLFALGGYPKIKNLPRKRRRLYLFN